MTVCCRHLFHDVDDFHQWIPSCEVGVRGELECVIDGFVEQIVACSLDVQVQEPVVVLTKYEIGIDRCLGGAIESRDGNICWIAGCIKLGISIKIKNGGSCPIIYRLWSGSDSRRNALVLSIWYMGRDMTSPDQPKILLWGLTRRCKARWR